MLTLEIRDAMEQLSDLVGIVVQDQCKVVLTLDGKPMAKLVPYDKPDVSRRIGGGRACFTQAQLDWIDNMTLEEFNASDAEIARLFYGEDEKGSGP